MNIQRIQLQSSMHIYEYRPQFADIPKLDCPHCTYLRRTSPSTATSVLSPNGTAAANMTRRCRRRRRMRPPSLRSQFSDRIRHAARHTDRGEKKNRIHFISTVLRNIYIRYPVCSVCIKSQRLATGTIPCRQNLCRHVAIAKFMARRTD